MSGVQVSQRPPFKESERILFLCFLRAKFDLNVFSLNYKKIQNCFEFNLVSQLDLNFLFARVCRCFTIVVATSNLAYRNFIPSENSLSPLIRRRLVAQLRKLRIQVQSFSLRCGASLCNFLKAPLSYTMFRLQAHNLQLRFRCSLCIKIYSHPSGSLEKFALNGIPLQKLVVYEKSASANFRLS